MNSGTRLTLFVLALGATACTQTPAPVVEAPKSESAQTLMLRVAKQAQACWFKKKDPALRPYKMAAELNSFSGKPRFLIVPRNRPTGLPKLVAQAEKIGGQNRFSIFGPLLDGPSGARLQSDLNAWATGRTTC